jgi:membrane-associated phospholipid phosphatase
MHDRANYQGVLGGMKSSQHGLRVLGLTALLALGLPCVTWAGCSGDGPSGGILHLDRCDEFEGKGIYARNNQLLLDALVVSSVVGVSLWEGTDTELGRTAWKTLDAMAIAAVSTEVMKNVFQRPRPEQNSNPNLWRQGSGNKSFPSGETAMMAAFVTPYIMAHQDENPWVWGLMAFPVYMGRARMASEGHWMSDVLVGAAVGVAAGYYAQGREKPLVLSITHDGVFVGIHHRY